MNVDTLTQVDGWQERQQTTPAEQSLYDYWRNRVRVEPPESLLTDFRSLFIEGRSVQEAGVYSALEKVVKTKDAGEKFNYCLNRCCHILIECWQEKPQSHPAILELIGLFEQLPPARSGYYGSANNLRNLVNRFNQSHQYLKLQRVARAIVPQQRNNSIGSLIPRYPYLYDHCLLSEDSSTEYQQMVRRIKKDTERRFEIALSRYITYKVRLAKVSRSPNQAGESRRELLPVPNPTLLSDSQLSKVLKQLMGKVEGGQTYKSLSCSFVSHALYAPTFQIFKEELYEYLKTSLDSSYGKGQLLPKLSEFLEDILPQSHSQKPSEFLMLRTTSQLLNFLVVENARRSEHYLFIDMITNLGVSRTIGLLLKLVLICPKVKPYLEKRFSLLFEHYEFIKQNEVPWLVKSLEYLQLAFSLYFGKINLSGLN